MEDIKGNLKKVVSATSRVLDLLLGKDLPESRPNIADVCGCNFIREISKR
jgi:hypothetical protein